ncbi:LysR family transcriptional regulator [Pararhizobium sp. YC-54]|uniref:LysR family transcriptional regulator n=1 Tax=Pararhizobium sp. YC-54 TaxID=2986920 RepID=UPI0021F77929|nr:LysR family transcriptional regulator [Pararhizobium sp. YC-54]MCW0001904.1 LysR family transcriptional regulator [Pararhizobium sp. YC-54]
MNIEHIRAFLEVTTTGSFQHAADQLNVTQSTISARIKALEERLNRQLFHRKRNGVALTTGGHQFHPSAVNIVRAWERGQQVATLPEGSNAFISLGVEDNHWARIVPGWLKHMSDALPDGVASAIAEHSDVLMEKLRAGLLDIAVLYDPRHCAEARIEPLLTEELVMVSARPRAVESGVVPGYVFVDWGETFRAQHSMHFPGVFSHKLTIRNSAVAMEHILANNGSGYFLAASVEADLKSGRLHLVDGAPSFQRTVFLAIRIDAITPENIETAVDALRAAIA